MFFLLSSEKMNVLHVITLRQLHLHAQFKILHIPRQTFAMINMDLRTVWSMRTWTNDTVCTPIFSSVRMTPNSLHAPLGSIYIVFYIYRWPSLLFALQVLCSCLTILWIRYKVFFCILCKQSVNEYVYHLKGAITHMLLVSHYKIMGWGKGVCTHLVSWVGRGGVESKLYRERDHDSNMNHQVTKDMYHI